MGENKIFKTPINIKQSSTTNFKSQINSCDSLDKHSQKYSSLDDFNRPTLYIVSIEEFFTSAH